MRICTDRYGISVAVVQDGVILSDGSHDLGAAYILDDRYRQQMLSFLGEHLCGNPPCSAVDLGIGSSLKPCDGKRVQRAVIARVNAILDKAVLDVSDNILDLAFGLRIGASAHIYPEPALLTEFFKLRCVDDIAVVLRNADDTVLVEYKLLWHTADVFEAFP
ncbi:MAG: hypothetical protein IIT86_13245, partial [Oscillospiraceae bacterium]|nr:hypothetical protein [Oscillospiraceae bacterium]